jgi:two-component system sensor histidine kinase DesK
MAPFVLPMGQALGGVVSFAALTALVSFFAYDANVWYFVSMPAVIMIVAIGGANVLYAENVRRRAQVRRAQEEVDEMAAVAERERISRDLHDLLGHTLSVIALKSELASKLSAVDPARAAAEIRDVEQISRGALSEVRSAVEGFRSRGFAGELRNAGRAFEAAGVRFDAVGAEVRMPPRQEGVMALALREATTNVIRHARASTCRAELRTDDGWLILTVQDDGAGAVAREGHGLTGMRERAAALGGRVTVENEGGTRVTMRLPL